ncbi:MAG: M18 family aminopeptidase [Bacilli bacterium]
MNKLQEIRKKSGLTQQEIAKKIGISQQAYGNYERDETSIPSKMVEKIAQILMIDPALLGHTSELENDSITEFLAKSLTSYHAVHNAIELLRKEGFEELKENESWKIKEGGKYYVTKNRSALIAFKVGDLSHYSFNIASCHTDSPSLKVKGNSLLDSPEGKRINVEKYGGLINFTFLDIPLKVAGRVFLEKENGFEARLIDSDFTVNIPSLAIHHNPTVNDGVELKIQSDMLPLLGKCEDLYQTLLPNDKIIDADLYCVPAVKPTYTGADSEFLVSPRIDNLSSLYAIVKAILEADTKGIAILYATDNEEVGSLSKQGAESIFLTNVLERINTALKKSRDDYHRAIFDGFMLSIDNGHAVHPAHPEKSDPVVTAKLNEGVVIKHHPNYATDGFSSSIVKTIAKKNDVLVQDYYNNSDIRCGSTIGLVTSAQLGINTCDIGLAELAMHSGIETVGKHDIQRMIKLVKCFFETNIVINDKETIIAK